MGDQFRGFAHAIHHARIVDLAGNAQGLRQIIRAQEDHIEAWHRDDRFEIFETFHALDVDEHHRRGIEAFKNRRAIGEIASRARIGRNAPHAQRRILGRPHHGFGIGFGANLRHLHPARADIQRTQDLRGIVFPHPHDRRDPDPVCDSAEILAGGNVERPVFRIENDKIKSAVSRDLDERARTEIDERPNGDFAVGKFVFEQIIGHVKAPLKVKNAKWYSEYDTRGD